MVQDGHLHTKNGWVFVAGLVQVEVLVGLHF